MARVVKIISDGTPYNTRIVLDTGEELKGVKAIEWHINADNLIADIKLCLAYDIQIDLIGEIK